MSKNLVKSTLIVMATVFVVLICLAVLIGIFRGISKTASSSRQLPFVRTKAAVAALHTAVNMFKLDTGRYPKTLKELIEQPTDVEGWNPEGYLESTEVPKDGWRNDFVYRVDPESGHPFVIISYGADGKEGGYDSDADLWSTDRE